MVTTKHCCYGVCHSDSRYNDREHMKGVFFIPFPKPHKNRGKCERWLTACRRDNFGVKNITKDTYICSLHFPGDKGPTKEHPDPVAAATTSLQIEKLSRKRKPPTARCRMLSKKRQQLDIIEAAGILMQMSEGTERDSSCLDVSPCNPHTHATNCTPLSC